MGYLVVGFVLGLGTAYKFVVEPVKIEIAALKERLSHYEMDRKEPAVESDDSQHPTF